MSFKKHCLFIAHLSLRKLNRLFLERIPLTLCLMFILFQSCKGHDQAPFNEPENVQLSLISAKATLSNEPKIWVGLRVRLAPGWKTYWRSPGVAGYSIRLDSTSLHNVKNLQIHWPLPHHFQTTSGIVNVYEGDFILPISLEVQDLTKPVQGTLKVNMLVCDKSLCVPVQQSMALTIPVGTGEENTSQVLQIINALNHVPLPENTTTIQISDAEIITNDIPPTVRLRLTRPEGFSPLNLPEVFMEMKGYFLDAPLASLSSDHKTVVYSALVFPDENRVPGVIPNLIGKPINLTIGVEGTGERYGFELEKVLQKQSLTWAFVLSILMIAFIGGLILNIMPCVMPVLSLKVFSIMRQGGRERKHIRRDFMATSLGILCSFLILALVNLLLKSAGYALGWGVQFQEPIFVMVLISLLIIFSSNLFGFFEFRLPDFVTSVGGLKPHHEGLIGSFLEGSLVTILATPCTAPFVGTALAFSLSRGPLEIVAVFFTMGLGLSFPFLLMALFPRLAAKLPKPGKWINRVKIVLGFFLIATACWLLFVLKGQIGMKSVILVATLMALVMIILSMAHVHSERIKKLDWVAVGVLIILSLGIATSSPRKTLVKSETSKLWQLFEPDRIPQYVKDNKIVFVNVTADWCLTCQVNKYFVLKSQAVIDELSKEDVVAMEADWTNHSQLITSYLESFNQYGIPFYAVYGCQHPTGILLGQLLTVQNVIDALRAERCPPQ